MPYRKVLIIRLSALGDVAMTIPWFIPYAGLILKPHS